MIADLHCDTISKLRDYHLGRLVSEDDKNGTSGVDEGKKQNRDDEGYGPFNFRDMKKLLVRGRKRDFEDENQH